MGYVSNHRWIVGGKLCLLSNQWGLIVAWACDTANVADNTFQWLIRQFEERMILGFYQFMRPFGAVTPFSGDL